MLAVFFSSGALCDGKGYLFAWILRCHISQNGAILVATAYDK
ncbi:hypothetical protein OAT72_03070 [Alphaproteobacteria bacterium]|nr:hypothetical protein [Alphaproteobacteria bacterium]